MTNAATLLHPNDDVLIALQAIPVGGHVGEGIHAASDIVAGHKIARRAVKKGDPVIRYNQIIGFASADIVPGDHVHLQNLAMADFERDYAFCQNAKPTDYFAKPGTFMGYRRVNGKAATRNYIGIVSSVNCSATAAKQIAKHYEGMHFITFALMLIIPSTAAISAEVLTLRAGVPEGLPGYTMSADGKLIIELPYKKRIFQCIEKGLNAHFVWEAYPTKRVVQMVIDGTLDMAFPMGFTSERAGKMSQSHPTWENPDTWVSTRRLDINDKSLRIAARLGSPQQADYVTEGYSNVIGTYTYDELIRTLVTGLADAVIIPQSVYADMKSDWPKEARVTVGQARNSGFYLNASDPKGLLAPLNRAIDRCRYAT